MQAYQACPSHQISWCLGLIVDSTLSWKPHVTELSKTLANSVGIFFKIRHYLTLETLKLLYYSLFYCFISYCISVWGLSHPSVLDRPSAESSCLSLRKVKKWLEANRFSLNLEKTNYVIFHYPAKRTDEFIQIKLGCEPIKHVHHIKYLGVLD